MTNPCLDEYFVTLDSLDAMMDYHDTLTRQTQWLRTPVKKLRVMPIEDAPPLFIDRSLFDFDVSEEAVADTASRLGLAIRTEDNPFFRPLRDTAWKSLLDRAKINGTALPKLSRFKLAEVLNSCLELHSADALLLVRDEKVAAVHSGDSNDYSILPINDLLTMLETKLEERFPEYEFDSGYSFCLPLQ